MEQPKLKDLMKWIWEFYKEVLGFGFIIIVILFYTFGGYFHFHINFNSFNELLKSISR